MTSAMDNEPRYGRRLEDSGDSGEESYAGASHDSSVGTPGESHPETPSESQAETPGESHFGTSEGVVQGAEASQGMTQPSGESASATTPWPQYGHVGAHQTPSYGTYPGATSPSNAQPYSVSGPQPGAYTAPTSQSGVYGTSAQQPGTSAQQSGTASQNPGAYSTQAQHPGATPQYPGDYNAQAQEPRMYPHNSGPTPQQPGGYPNQQYPKPPLPGRGGAIALLVVGVVMAFVIAPITLVVGVVLGADIPSFVDSMSRVESGQVVTVDDSGSYFVFSQSQKITECFLDDPAGLGTYELKEAGAGTFYERGIEPGSYMLLCDGPSSAELFGMTGLSPNTLVKASLWGFGLASVVGIIGIVLTIWGIVRLVRVNRKRREILRSPYQPSW